MISALVHEADHIRKGHPDVTMSYLDHLSTYDTQMNDPTIVDTTDDFKAGTANLSGRINNGEIPFDQAETLLINFNANYSKFGMGISVRGVYGRKHGRASLEGKVNRLAARCT